ncbi:universal stress protein [Leifsonia shinshuensis]|uniref:Universal stress protein n=1 Tax=Leifsonia shinshuensis TaxID=150026 RepID=A0A7G6YEQ9_9MICO|nr:universal stress protein [Leifsonia shinshuensis]QNE36974.1 universal stress protein [Leifsonia shinshuensis]
MNDRTVVGWDGSEEAGVALEWAVRRAKAEHDSIVLVDVEDVDALAPGQVVTDEMVARRHLAADAEAQRVTDANGGLRVSTHVMAGERLDELQRFSRADNLLVVGTGRRHWPHVRYDWSLGSRLAARARGAVAVIPALPEPTHTAVVVGVDGSEVSLKAARFAAREARRLGGRLRLVHAWLDPLVGIPEVQQPDGRFTVDLEAEHDAILQSVARTVRAANPDLEVTASLIRDDARQAVLSSLGDAALLVVGTEQARGLDRMMLGSVSHALILAIRVPTIVVAPECLI